MQDTSGSPYLNKVYIILQSDKNNWVDIKHAEGNSKSNKMLTNMHEHENLWKQNVANDATEKINTSGKRKFQRFDIEGRI